MSKEALDSLGLDTDNTQPWSPFVATTQKTNFLVCMSPREGHFPEVNILGADFLCLFRVKLTVDYREAECAVRIGG